MHHLLVRNVKSEEFDIYIGRNNRKYKDLGYSNPFKLYANTDRARYLCLIKYSENLLTKNPQSLTSELTGKLLGCWCAPLLCHGVVLSMLVNNPADIQTCLSSKNTLSPSQEKLLDESLSYSFSERVDNVKNFATLLTDKFSKEPFKVLVTGSRTWKDEFIIHSELNTLLAKFPQNLTLVHGGAAGADSIAHNWALANHVNTEVWEANWELHGKKAGPIRNSMMIKSGADYSLAFLENNSSGTMHAIAALKKAGVSTKISAV
jgi:hypothetical protein